MISKISYNMAIIAVSRVVTAVLGLVVIGVMSRYLGPAGYGQYTTIFSYLLIFLIFADFGLHTIHVREISRPQSDEKFISSNIFTIRLFLIIFFSFTAFLIIQLLPYENIIKTGTTIGSIFLIFSSLNQILAGVYQKYLRFYIVSLSDIAAKVTQLIVVLLAAKLNLGFFYFIWAVAISAGIQFLLIFILARRFVKISLAFNFGFWKKILITSFPIAASLVFTMIYFRIDTIMLSLLKSQTEVGIYGIAVKVLEVVIFLPAMYMGLVMPSLSRFAVSSRDLFLKIYRRTFNILNIFGALTILLIFILAPQIVQIIGGPEFSASTTPLRLIALAIGLIFLGNLGGQSLVALDLQKYGMWIYLLGAILNIAGNIIFIPRFSYNAAAATTVGTEIIVTFLMFYLIKTKTGNTLEFKILFKSILSGLVAFLLIYPLRNLNFILVGFLATIFYLSILYILKGITAKDIKDLVNSDSGIEIEDVSTAG